MSSSKTKAATGRLAEAKARLERLLNFDREALSSSCSRQAAQLIVGCDEVGRGCLAGPVVACATVLPPILPGSSLFEQLAGLDDSKLVSPPARQQLAATLRAVCQFSIAEASVEEIDRINVLNASLLAMQRAIENLVVDGKALILIDGNKTISQLADHLQMPVIAGDSKSASIAAASIIAKVYRDCLMSKLSEDFPQYCWNSNKGYGSTSHRAAMAEHGMTVWHRRTFKWQGS